MDTITKLFCLRIVKKYIDHDPLGLPETRKTEIHPTRILPEPEIHPTLIYPKPKYTQPVFNPPARIDRSNSDQMFEDLLDVYMNLQN